MRHRMTALHAVILFTCFTPSTWALRSENFTIDLSEMNFGGGIIRSDSYQNNSTIDANLGSTLQQSESYHLESGLIELEQYCGNGLLEMGEQCDDGNENNQDTCSNTCQLQEENNGGGGQGSGGGGGNSNKKNNSKDKQNDQEDDQEDDQIEIKQNDDQEEQKITEEEVSLTFNPILTLTDEDKADLKPKIIALPLEQESLPPNSPPSITELNFLEIFTQPIQKQEERMSLEPTKEEKMTLSCVGLNESIRYAYIDLQVSTLDFLEKRAVIKVGSDLNTVSNYDFLIDSQRDSDGDEILDIEECPNRIEICLDSDGDSLPDFLDTDSDNDGWLDRVEGNIVDTDLDGIRDYVDVDSEIENSGDSDHDGITDNLECPSGFPCLMSDEDATPDYLDRDSNQNGIEDRNECEKGIFCHDTDGDLIPDYLDRKKDSDGDGLHDMDECPGGSPCMDSDRDTIPDYLDSDSDGDGLTDDVECGGKLACLDVNRNGMKDVLDPSNGTDYIPNNNQAQIKEIKPLFFESDDFLIEEGLIFLSHCKLTE